MSNLAGMIRALLANARRLPMDTWPTIRWASWAVVQPDRRTQIRLGFETPVTFAAGFRRPSRPSRIAASGGRTLGRRRRHARVGPFRRPATERATQFIPALRYIREAFRFAGPPRVPDMHRAAPVDGLLDRLRNPVPAGLAAPHRTVAQHCSTIISLRWYGTCIPFG
ncbi:hypothetical protein K8353_04000 [Burkholderia contaminans]|nr:hypothetical protein [Burkholderia contaminans]